MIGGMIQKIIPPFCADIYFKHIKKKRIKGFFETWQEAQLQCGGYDDKIIFDKVKNAILAVRDGRAAHERDSVLFDEIEYSWQTLSGLLLASANNGGALNVLDFGGSLGTTYFQNRKFLKELKSVRWNIVEQTHFVEYGQKELVTEELRFYKSIEECMRETNPNVILISVALQYIENYADILDLVNKLPVEFLILDSFPISKKMNEEYMIKIQKVPAKIYEASYPCYIFNPKKIYTHLTEYRNIESSENFYCWDDKHNKIFLSSQILRKK